MNSTLAVCLQLPVFSAVMMLMPLVAKAQPTVWTGPSITFTKPPNAFPPPQDSLTANVAFTRGGTAGLYNAAVELGYSATSPLDTVWATSLNNPGKTISAANWADLNFTTWTNAYGGGGSLATNITALNAVVHLMSDDVYLDLRFTSWDVGREVGGGGFSYERSTPSLAVTPDGDYNVDGKVDAADYVIWRSTHGQAASPAGSGADGNANGTIDDGDYDFWRARFGNIVAGAGGAALAVPEPAAAVLLVCGLLALLNSRRRGRQVSV